MKTVQKTSTDPRFLGILTRDLLQRMELVDPKESKGVATIVLSDDGSECLVKVKSYGEPATLTKFCSAKGDAPYFRAAAFARDLQNDGYKIIQ